MGELFPPEKRRFWTQKLARSMARDREVNAMLSDRGWQVVRVWASEVLTNTDAMTSRVAHDWRGQAFEGSTQPRRG
jgi:DNA mismatch endonuclease (patch repair protein)